MSLQTTERYLSPVPCVIEEDHRDRQLADLAVEGHFLHTGTLLDLGPVPNWLRDGLDHDEEWRIEWVKMYEGLDLGAAYQDTGDSAYLRTWEQMVLSYCDQVAVGHDSSDVTARRVQNWLYAAQRFSEASSPAVFRPGFLDVLVNRLDADVDHMSGNLTKQRNHRTMELYTLLLTAIARGNRTRAIHALGLIEENATEDIWSDGTHRECSSDYHCIVLRSFVGAAMAARSIGLAVPGPLMARIDAAATVAMYLQRPDGTMPAFSDGDEGDYRTLLRQAATVLRREDLLWVSSMGLHGSPPDSRGASFTVGGVVTQRSGWGAGTTAYEDEWWAVLDCGPIGDGGHGHYDQLHVDLYANGRPLVIDPGRFTYADGPDGWRRWFKGTAAHNTITVDGLDQVRYRPGRPRGPLSTAGLISRREGATTDTVVAGAESPQHDARHTRTLTLRHGCGWTITDRVVAPTPHDYVLRWHLPANATGQVTLHPGHSRTVVATPGAHMAISGADVVVSLEEGWVSPTYGVKQPAPVIRADVGPSSEATFVTEVTPC